ncbi:MAG: hypothetical protein LKG38_03810 [Atopobiaceae bacterium]|nr:hypothetical protein [Atopobiaceae bacterium]MCH4119770.1 hypothetical protein [Atopobiaceae bacterium]MCI1318452.1 hypothetical protein [Atopobiaceae bacterium]MCI1388845.1 hypothetical protein [Atopobiaceae bacterium]MCI1432535.1 hypothetical protein [Atopobiaceae bacterium]
MHLKQTRRGDRIYLSVVQNYRVGGKTKTRTIESLGYVDELEASYPDPVAHFRAYVAELNERRAQEAAPIAFSIPRDARIGEGEGGQVQLGAGLALAYMDAFGVGAFLRSRPRSQVPQGRPDRMFELLCSARMLHAVPKREAWDGRGALPRSCPGAYADLYRALPVIAREGPALVAHLGRAYERLRGPRNLRRVTLVLSSYVFEWASGYATGSLPDEAPEAERRRLCVAIDGDGIPIGYRIVAAEPTPEQCVSLVADVKACCAAASVTLVASVPLPWEEVAGRLVRQGDGLVAQLSSDDPGLASWLASDVGYEDFHGTYQVKSDVIDVDGRGGASEGVAGSRSVQVRRIALRNAPPAVPASIAGVSGSARRRRGAPICIASTLVEASDAFNLNIYRELWRMHEPFQVVSADFVDAPYAIPVEQHLEAHFVICYAAFFLLRVMRRDLGWRFDAASVAGALERMEGTYLAESWYLFSYRSEASDAIQSLMGLECGRRIMSRSDVRSAIVRARGRLVELGPGRPEGPAGPTAMAGPRRATGPKPPPGPKP